MLKSSARKSIHRILSLALVAAIALAMAAYWPSNTALAEIDVQGKVVEPETLTVYKVDVAWGDMKFAYGSGERIWDPETHTYTTDIAEGWLVDNADEDGATATEWYLEDGNNEITVINHSNSAIDAVFSYAMSTGADIDSDIDGDATAYNADGASPDAVAGGFYASEDDAKAGALVLTNPGASTDYNTLPGSKISLPTAEGRNLDSAEITGYVYFAFSGTPDANRREVLPVFKKVGAITVTIAPNDDVGLNTPGTDF